MSHHSEEYDNEIQAQMKEFLDGMPDLDGMKEFFNKFKEADLGPTGKFPEGKLTEQWENSK